MYTGGLVNPTFSATHPFSVPAAAGDCLLHAAEQQAAWVSTTVADIDPQAWLFDQRARRLRGEPCDPWAEQMLVRAGFLPLAS